MSNIVVLVGSMRRKGNTATLVSSFAEGAKANGNEVSVVSVADYKVTPCTGCNVCRKTVDKRCCVKDDMAKVFDTLKEADVIVLASPVYFYGISARLKAIIDRLHQPARSELKVKRLGLLLVAADTLPAVFDAIKLQYKLVLDYFSLTTIGEVFAYGVEAVGDIVGKDILEEAYALGKKTE